MWPSHERSGDLELDPQGQDALVASLQERLAAAQRRVDAAMPGSPEWEAALDAATDLHREAASIRRPHAPARSVVVPFGPVVLLDGFIVRGIVAAQRHDAHALAELAVARAAGCGSRRDYVNSLEALARSLGFVVEVGGDTGEISVYAWEAV